MRTVLGLVLVLFGIVNAMRELANFEAPSVNALSFLIGLLLPSILIVAAGIYLMVTKKKL